MTHLLWLPKPASAILSELVNAGTAEGLMFANNRGNPVRTLDAAMRSICAKLEMGRTTPHDLRRTHGTTVTGLGFGRDAMNRIQNHKEGSIASVYDRHGYADENKKVMEAVAKRIVALAEGRGPRSNVVPMRA